MHYFLYTHFVGIRVYLSDSYILLACTHYCSITFLDDTLFNKVGRKSLALPSRTQCLNLRKSNIFRQFEYAKLVCGSTVVIYLYRVYTFTRFDNYNWGCNLGGNSRSPIFHNWPFIFLNCAHQDFPHSRWSRLWCGAYCGEIRDGRRSFIHIRYR